MNSFRENRYDYLIHFNLKIELKHSHFFERLFIKVLFICLLISFNFIAWSQSFNTFSASQQKVSVAFEYINNFILVDILLDEKLPLKFILDTGAEHSILTKKEVAEVLNFQYVKKFKIVGADMNRELIAHLVTNIHFRIGALEEENVQMLVLDEDYFLFEELTGQNIQGILGGDFLRKYVVEIDYKRKRLTIHNPKFFKPKKKHKVIPIMVKNNKPFIKSDLVLQNLEPMKASVMLIDSGAGVTLLLDSDESEAIQIPENAVPGNIGSGLGGQLLGYFGLLPEISIGQFNLKNIPMNFQVKQNDSIEINLFKKNGLIGNQILDRFKVIIDYRRDKLYLQPNKRLYKPFKFDKSGISVIATGFKLRKYLIQSVMRDSPAGEAGLKPGDQILSLNNIPYKFLSLKGINKRLKRKVGKKTSMVIKREGVKKKVKFELRNLLEN